MRAAAAVERRVCMLQSLIPPIPDLWQTHRQERHLGNVGRETRQKEQDLVKREIGSRESLSTSLILCCIRKGTKNSRIKGVIRQSFGLII